MRKLSTLFFALLISAFAFGQSAQKLKKVNPAMVKEYRQIDRTGVIEQAINMSHAGTNTSTVPIGTVVTDAVTSIKIGESSNAFTFVVDDNNQITTVPNVGTLGGSVAFIYRQDINACGGTSGDNGKFRYSISTDGGNTWNTGAGTPAGGCYGLGPINPLYSQASRYPNAALFLPPGQATDPSNLAMVYSGPVLTAAGSGWDGNVLGLVTNVTTTPVSAQEVYPFQAGNQYFSYSLTQRVPGEFWYGSWSWDGTNVGSNLIINKGLYDSTTNTVLWSTVTTISPNYSLTFDGNPRRAGLNIAFSPDGTVGHVAFLGDLIGNQDSVYAPCWSTSTDGGNTWSAFQEFDFTRYTNFGLLSAGAGIGNGFIDIDTNTLDTIPVSDMPTTAFNFDMTVDKNGNPHIAAVVGPGTFSNSDGTYTDPGYSIFGSVGYNIFDFTPDSYGDMNMVKLGDQATLRGTFGDQTGTTSDFTTADPWMQASRSPGGEKVFFTWTDSDTTGVGGTDNSTPNLIGAGYDVDLQLITPQVNFTGDDANWASRAIMPKISPVAFYDKAQTHTIPTVIMDIGPPGTSLLNPVDFWYFSDVSFDNSDFTIPAEFFFNCKEMPITGAITQIAPDCGMSDGALAVAASGGVATPYTYEWSNGSSTDSALNLAAGIYSVVVTDSVGCFAAFTYTLNNANAPALTISGSTDITCNGENNGSATVTATGGTGTVTYMWDNGENTATAVSLGAGAHTVTATDANGCSSFISVTITEPSGINLAGSGSTLDCFGDVSGTASASAFGGTGALTYSWSSGQTTPAISGLGGGSYTVYVTDANSCVDSLTVSVSEPAELTNSMTATPNTSVPPTGTLTATPAGGSGTYTVNWTGPDGFTQNNSPFIFGLCGGTYYATITDANGCVKLDSAVIEVSGTGEPCVTNTDGISDELRAGINTMSIVPNPSQGTFEVNLEMQNLDAVTMELIDLSGKQITARKMENALYHRETFNMTHLSAGLYLLKVKTSKGSATRKLVIR
ncbi:MAG: T9SS type A sorting domain-containing protein [Bacteroidetes bacterium]|nr:T9SS type A sorting domain-containing protein [Bacteroidota bacterium]